MALHMVANKSSYFPAGTFSPDSSDLDAFVQQWYGKHLFSMGEMPMYPTEPTVAETYRFTCLPTFDSPFALRLGQTVDGLVLTARLTNGHGGYDPGDLIVDENIPITVRQFNRVRLALEKADYWSLQPVIDDRGLDGTHFIVEAVRESRYHVVDRWCPDNGPYRVLCDEFVSLCPRRIRKLMQTG